MIAASILRANSYEAKLTIILVYVGSMGGSNFDQLGSIRC